MGQRDNPLGLCRRRVMLVLGLGGLRLLMFLVLVMLVVLRPRRLC
jgi:hypothetical protein